MTQPTMLMPLILRSSLAPPMQRPQRPEALARTRHQKRLLLLQLQLPPLLLMRKSMTMARMRDPRRHRWHCQRGKEERQR